MLDLNLNLPKLRGIINACFQISKLEYFKDTQAQKELITRRIFLTLKGNQSLVNEKLESQIILDVLNTIS